VQSRNTRNRKQVERFPRPVRAITSRTENYPLASSYRTKLKYSAEVVLDAVAGSYASYAFRAADLYDPDYSGTGHQPYGFDQLCSSTGLYDQFIVRSATCQIRLCNTSAYTQHLFGMVIDQPTVVGSSVHDFLEQPRVASKLCPGTANGGLTNTIILRYDACKFFRLTQSALMAKTDLQGGFASSPAEMVYFIFGVQSVASDNPAAVPIQVDIEYDAIFLEPRHLAAS
jgi:hypothetical protein